MKRKIGLVQQIGGVFVGALMIVSLVGLVNARAPKQSKGEALVQVEARYVCMINSTHFDKEQIPVKVQGRTYYGCCPMCADKLRNSAESRHAIDPVSGKKVDKATAVLGAARDGKVFYFESIENLKKFRYEPDGNSVNSKAK